MVHDEDIVKAVAVGVSAAGDRAAEEDAPGRRLDPEGKAVLRVGRSGRKQAERRGGESGGKRLTGQVRAAHGNLAFTCAEFVAVQASGRLRAAMAHSRR